MRWPFCWRAELVASEARVAWTEKQLAAAEDLLDREREQYALALKDAAERLEAARAENHKLFDRIVEMTGQPPIYEKPSPMALVPSTVEAPAPPTRLTFDDVHKAAQSAMARGDFRVSRGRAN